MPDTIYTHGHDDSVLRSHRWRTAANSAAYLLASVTTAELVKLPRSGLWENWKSRRLCGISKCSGKVPPLDFSTERVFPRPCYPQIVL